MQDRVSLYPGRVKLTPVAGQENTFDLVRADQPTQEGTPLNKATLLKDVTASILGLPNTAVPDDAFLALTIGVGTYGFRVKIQLADGTPVEGATVSGITALTGSTLISGADGIVLGKSTSKTVTIGCTSPYIDQAAPPSQSVTATGTITDVTLTLTAITDMITVTSSKIVKVSPMAKTVDVTAVGGGGGGGSGIDNGGKGTTGGSGGGGGYVNTVLGADAKAGSITITIGSGGTPSARTTSSGTSTGGTGGKTTVKIRDTVVCEAAGGSGGISGPYNSAATIPSGGAGNGTGGRGSGGETYESYAGMPGTAGSKYIFDDTSLGLAGGGGGGGGTGWGDTPALLARNVGGAPSGGKGRSRNSSGTYDGSAGKVMGGGGGGGCQTTNGYNGGAGGVYLRFHF